jgi:hypothetical protein
MKGTCRKAATRFASKGTSMDTGNLLPTSRYGYLHGLKLGTPRALSQTHEQDPQPQSPRDR